MHQPDRDGVELTAIESLVELDSNRALEARCGTHIVCGNAGASAYVV